MGGVPPNRQIIKLSGMLHHPTGQVYQPEPDRFEALFHPCSPKTRCFMAEFNYRPLALWGEMRANRELDQAHHMSKLQIGRQTD